MRRLPHALALAVVVLLALALGSAPAGAQDEPSPDAEDAAERAVEEFSILHALGVFGDGEVHQLTPLIQKDLFAGLSRTELIDELHAVELDGADALARLESDGIAVSSEVEAVLQVLSESQYAALYTGELHVPPGAYDVAVGDLLLADGEKRTDRTSPYGGRLWATIDRVEAELDGVIVSPSGATPTTAAPSPQPASPSSGDSRTLPLVLAAVVGVGLGYVIVRRKAPGAQTAPASPKEPARPRERDAIHPAVLELGRQIAGEHDASLIVERTAETVGELFPEGAVSVVVGGDESSGEHPPLIRRVLEVGQPSIGVVADRGWLAAVPALAKGRVCAVVTVAQPSPPEDPYATEPLFQLAPVVAAALEGARRHRQVEASSYVDGLTELANRRRLDRDLDFAVTQPETVGFVMIDVDHFKTFNDSHGHGAGDLALQRVARALQRAVREADVVYRYGGEEFAVLLWGADDERAREVGERVRATVEEDEEIGLTVSVGVAVGPGEESRDVAERADRALYAAKAAGRNRVVAD